jgi:hypothetical protein
LISASVTSCPEGQGRSSRTAVAVSPVAVVTALMVEVTVS